MKSSISKQLEWFTATLCHKQYLLNHLTKFLQQKTLTIKGGNLNLKKENTCIKALYSIEKIFI